MDPLHVSKINFFTDDVVTVEPEEAMHEAYTRLSTKGVVTFLTEDGVIHRFGRDALLDVGHFYKGVNMRFPGGYGSVQYQIPPPDHSPSVAIKEIETQRDLVTSYIRSSDFSTLRPGCFLEFKLEKIVILTVRLEEDLIYLARIRKYPILGRGSFFAARIVVYLNPDGTCEKGGALLKPRIKERFLKCKEFRTRAYPSETEEHIEKKARQAVLVTYRDQYHLRTKHAQIFKDCLHVHVDERLISGHFSAKSLLLAPLAEMSGTAAPYLQKDPLLMLQMYENIFRGLSEIHHLGFLSGDVKLANCLFINHVWKLGDNHFLSQGKKDALKQTLEYLSPEYRKFLQGHLGFHRTGSALVTAYGVYEDQAKLLYETKTSDEVFSLMVVLIEVYFIRLRERCPPLEPLWRDSIADIVMRSTGLDIRAFNTFREIMHVINPPEHLVSSSFVGPAYLYPSTRPSALEIADFFKEFLDKNK